MKIFNGNIVANEDNEGEECSYEIESLKAEFEEDRSNVMGVVRCTGIIIESDAPLKINLEAEKDLYNEFASIEYNNADSDGQYREEAMEALRKRTGVDFSRIEII